MNATNVVIVRRKSLNGRLLEAAMTGACSILALAALCREAAGQILQPGTGVIVVKTVKPPDLPSFKETGQPVPYGLTRDDYERIVAEIPSAEWVDPLREVERRASYGSRSVTASVIGCTRAYFKRNPYLWIADGRFFAPGEDDRRYNVAVLGHSTAEELFGDEDPIDRSIRLREGYYKVVGVAEPPELSMPPGEALEKRKATYEVYIPRKTMLARTGDLNLIRDRSGVRVAEIVELTQIMVTLRDPSELEPTAEAIRSLLEKHHERVDYAITISRGWPR